MNITIIILLVFNLVLSSIIISYHFFKSQNKKEEKETKEDNLTKSSLEYRYKPHTVILCGVEYKSVKNASDILGIPVTTLDSWIKKYSPEVVDKKIQHYKPANNIVERTKYNIIIDGKEFEDHRELAKKLGIAVGTLNRWYRDNIIYDKFNEYNIDYKKILGIEEVKEEPVIEEPNKDNPIKYVWSAIRIDGKLFNDRKAVAEKLGISESTLNKWNREGILYEKFKEYGIDYKKILGIKEDKEVKEEPVNEVVKEKQGRPAKGYNKGLRGKKNKQRIRISNTMPLKILVKYGLKVNDEFDSFKHLREYIGIETQTVYNWHNNHWVEEIR